MEQLLGYLKAVPLTGLYCSVIDALNGWRFSGWWFCCGKLLVVLLYNERFGSIG